MIGSLFSGIGGLELGLERAGLGPVAWQVEIDPFCRRVLAKHWPEARRHEDVRKVRGESLGSVDVVCGGFPCQDVSAAGKGAGVVEGTRSGLWIEFARIVGEILPRFVVVENVASGKRRWLPRVRRDLHLLGYRTRAVQVSAFDVGAPHLRERVFVLASHSHSHSHSHSLRHEPEWRSGRRSRVVQGQGEGVARNDGAARIASDADGEGQPREGAPVGESWRWVSDGDRWKIEPPVCGVDDGLSGRVDRDWRLRALGNAVVPQCAEVVGRMIAEVCHAE